MKLRTIMVFGMGLALFAAPALAFQEQGGAAPVASELNVSPEAAAPAAQVGTEAAAKPAGGTEVNIPGLGKLGVLPKMDFGLELLYGADDAKPQESKEPGETEDGDLAIRGSVKHKF